MAQEIVIILGLEEEGQRCNKGGDAGNWYDRRHKKQDEMEMSDLSTGF